MMATFAAKLQDACGPLGTLGAKEAQVRNYSEVGEVHTQTDKRMRILGWI